jgi:hypothetical protein
VIESHARALAAKDLDAYAILCWGELKALYCR